MTATDGQVKRVHQVEARVRHRLRRDGFLVLVKPRKHHSWSHLVQDQLSSSLGSLTSCIGHSLSAGQGDAEAAQQSLQEASQGLVRAGLLLLLDGRCLAD